MKFGKSRKSPGCGSKDNSGMFAVASLLLDELRVGGAGDVGVNVHDVVAGDVVRRQVAEFVRVVRAVLVGRRSWSDDFKWSYCLVKQPAGLALLCNWGTDENEVSFFVADGVAVGFGDVVASHRVDLGLFYNGADVGKVLRLLFCWCKL